MILKGICAAAILLMTFSSVGWSDGEKDSIGIVCSKFDGQRTRAKDPCEDYTDPDNPLINCTSQASQTPERDKCGVRCEHFLYNGYGKSPKIRKEAFGGDVDKKLQDLTPDEREMLKELCEKETSCMWVARASQCATRRTGARTWPDMESPRRPDKAGNAPKGRPRANTR